MNKIKVTDALREIRRSIESRFPATNRVDFSVTTMDDRTNAFRKKILGISVSLRKSYMTVKRTSLKADADGNIDCDKLLGYIEEKLIPVYHESICSEKVASDTLDVYVASIIKVIGGREFNRIHFGHCNKESLFSKKKSWEIEICMDTVSLKVDNLNYDDSERTISDLVAKTIFNRSFMSLSVDEADDAVGKSVVKIKFKAKAKGFTAHASDVKDELTALLWWADTGA